jgi:hypothetical protein
MPTVGLTNWLYALFVIVQANMAICNMIERIILQIGLMTPNRTYRRVLQDGVSAMLAY